jgi:hypothetical protein
MGYFKIKANSKSRESIKKIFVTLFDKYRTNRNFDLTIKNHTCRIKKKRFSMLKSPHVNKIAQEQFEYRNYTFQYVSQVTDSIKFLRLIKLLKTVKLSDTNVLITSIFKQNSYNKIVRLVNPNYYKINLFIKNFLKLNKRRFLKKIYSKFKYQKMAHYLNCFDIYGELVIKKNLK